MYNNNYSTNPEQDFAGSYFTGITTPLPPTTTPGTTTTQTTTTRTSPGSSTGGRSSTSSSTARARESIEAEKQGVIIPSQLEDRRALEHAELLHGWYKDCCMYFAENYMRPPAPLARREIATIIKNGMTAECLKALMDESQRAPRPSWGYCMAIVRRCEASGIKTLADWKADCMRRESSRNPALNYKQREYSEEDFGPDFFVDLDKYGDNRVPGGDPA